MDEYVSKFTGEEIDAAIEKINSISTETLNKISSLSTETINNLAALQTSDWDKIKQLKDSTLVKTVATEAEAIDDSILYIVEED